MSGKKMLKFKNGCIRLGLDFEDITQNYKYCGGDTESDFKYWTLLNGDKGLPEHEDFCICGTAIKINCFIIKEENLLIVGSCCKNEFVKHKGRSCEICEAKHSRRLSNRCNDCKDFKKCEMINCMQPKIGYFSFCIDHNNIICREKNCHENKKDKSMYCINHFHRKCNNLCCKVMTEGYFLCYKCVKIIT